MNFNHTKNFNGRVLYSGPYWDDKEVNAIINAIQTGKWLTSGEYVHKFERAFGDKFNAKYSLMVNSGSSANLVMIAGLKKYLGWADDSEIIVSPVGFPTTIAPIYQNRLKPVFADIEWDTLNFDLNEVEKKITDKTVAIFVSPVLGNPPQMDFIKWLSSKYNLFVILDNCDSLGSKWDNVYLNEYAVAWSTSFYPAHHISTGEGGMVCSNEKELIDICRSVAWWGRDCYCVGSANILPEGTCKKRFSKWLDGYDHEIDHKYIFEHMGYNLKPLDLQGAAGLEQLKKFDEIDKKRKINYERMTGLFAELNIYSVSTYSQADVCWFGVPFITDKKHEIVKHLEKNGIQTRNYFAGNILLHNGYKFLDDYRNYPNANKVLDTVFFVGCTPHYTFEHFSHINKVLHEFNIR